MIDLRSDTVTQPCAAMRAAMLEAPLGDDVYGDDPTVNLLEATLAERAGKEAGLFLASGTQSNLCALLSHCGRGDEYIAGQDAHTYQYEAGGAAVLGGIQPQPIPWNERGELALQDIQRVIKPDDIHFAKTKLLCLENTVGGKTVSLDYTHQATSLARNHNLNCHLDGARVFNAAEKLKIDVKEICQPFDSISICLSKGLGAPAGSVLVGDADFIQRGRGDEYIAGQDAHTYQYEAGGAAVLGGIQPQPIPWNERGELALQDIQRVIKPDDIHFAKTKLLCLENTVGGKTVSLDYTHQATSLARNHNLNCHLDGARVFNAAEKLKIDVKEICQPFDSISICLSKGLGAPAGSVLVGDADFIQRARRWRKMLGGGMRQAGILAAAGLYALTHNVARLAEDHENARVLGEALSKIPGFSLAEPVQTNMVFLALEGDPMSALTSHLAEHRIKISGARWVLHKDVSAEHLKTIITACEAFAAERR